MSLIRGKNILKKFFKRPKINWSNYEFESSLQLNEFVDQLLEPIKNSQSRYQKTVLIFLDAIDHLHLTNQ